MDPPENAALLSGKMLPPYNTRAAGTTATMSGFVQDYINNYRVNNEGAEPTPEEYGVIMGGFDPDMPPVFSTLARSFAAYDHWHSAVPSQTFANRSFVHASTSHGFTINKGAQGFAKWIDPALNDAPIIFNRLQDVGISWAVYFDESPFISPLRSHPRTTTRAVLEDQLPRHDSVPPGRHRWNAAHLRLHRAAGDL